LAESADKPPVGNEGKIEKKRDTSALRHDTGVEQVEARTEQASGVSELSKTAVNSVGLRIDHVGATPRLRVCSL